MTSRRGIIGLAQLLLCALAACGVAAKTESTSNAGSDASTTGDACTDCFFLYDLHWGMDGGRVAYVDTSRLGPCRSYTRERSNGAVGMLPTMCHAEVSGCPDRTIDNIGRLIRDPVITMSLQNHALYGGDPRPSDGQVFRFGVGNDYVDVGSPCAAGASGCVGIPAPVEELVNLLEELDRVELASEPCKSVFGG